MQITSGQATLAAELVGQCTGEGHKDILFLHAGVTDRRSWTPIVKSLSATHRCISFDARGFGATTYGSEVGWSPVGDVLCVLDAVGSQRSVVVASSLGGRTAVDLALSHPDRVKALVLIAPAVRGAPYPEPTEREATLDAEAERAQEEGRIDDANALEAQLWLDGPASRPGRVVGAPRELFLDMNARALRSPDPGPMAVVDDAWPRLGEIAVPVLVLAGDLDVSDLRAIGRQMASRLPDAEFITIEGVAHLPQLEAPDRLTAVIRNFLESLG
ncbi:MAG: alpha/beta hydrolase [Actinomycetia bacterium]|nr:alpha/beta hydrolase [Actinomycetes bacterium]